MLPHEEADNMIRAEESENLMSEFVTLDEIGAAKERIA
jgi:hypothetical protein